MVVHQDEQLFMASAKVAEQRIADFKLQDLAKTA